MARKKFKVVSLFSGCGGMDYGLLGGFDFLGKHYDEHPFEIVWANEINSAACATYCRNIADNIICGDIRENLDSIPKGVDLLVGGFPCQDISINGKMKGVDGERSGLYRVMVDAIRHSQPRIFVAENVKGLLLESNSKSLERVLADFRSLNYEVTYALYHVADYGVPQLRERVLIVGTKKGEEKPFAPPPPILDKQKWVTVKDAIDDLVDSEWDASSSHIWSKAKRNGEQGNRTMDPSKPGYTIRAECHGNIQFHYRLPRRISMREAARIQSFSDDFIFESGLRETERQIGNAVPPVFAWHVGESLLAQLEE